MRSRLTTEAYRTATGTCDRCGDPRPLRPGVSHRNRHLRPLRDPGRTATGTCDRFGTRAAPQPAHATAAGIRDRCDSACRTATGTCDRYGTRGGSRVGAGPGKYVLACYMPSKVDGTPHDFMGMWKLVTIG